MVRLDSRREEVDVVLLDDCRRYGQLFVSAQINKSFYQASAHQGVKSLGSNDLIEKDSI